MCSGAYKSDIYFERVCRFITLLVYGMPLYICTYFFLNSTLKTVIEDAIYFDIYLDRHIYCSIMLYAISIYYNTYVIGILMLTILSIRQQEPIHSAHQGHWKQLTTLQIQIISNLWVQIWISLIFQQQPIFQAAKLPFNHKFFLLVILLPAILKFSVLMSSHIISPIRKFQVTHQIKLCS